MYEQCFESVADADALRFGIVNDVARHFELCAGIEENVDDSCTGFDDGNTRIIDNGADERGTTPRNENVDETARVHESVGAVSSKRVNRLNRSSGQTAVFERCPNDVDEDRVRVFCCAAAAQNSDIPALEQDCREVNRHIRSGFINRTNHTKRHANLRQV
ncbi:unannotated protein [freshwater metagenome]|uniref:Unannotated protein n=1 Tax=freshwater metagenome TaxID=449393 RepID=A0A6J6BR20_9ZZZZ